MNVVRAVDMVTHPFLQESKFQSPSICVKIQVSVGVVSCS